jgi:glucose-1-phosphate cytidylyltransferase
MKAVILAGGFGTRLSEETIVRPKPMVEIGGKPILWHIMNIYGAYGFNEFIIALGFKSEAIKGYFLNFFNLQNDLTILLKSGETMAAKNCYANRTNWIVHLVETGFNTMTGGRLYRLKDRLKEEAFLLTYGDGVSNVNIKRLVEFHKSHGKIATITAVRPPARFGEISFNNNEVIGFKEKPQTGEGWINGGFFVFEPKVFDYLSGDETVLEGDPLENLAKDGQLMAFKHEEFWQCMDTLRDKHTLEKLWESGNAPWKVWK